MTSFHSELLINLDEHSLKGTPSVIHLIYKEKKLSVEKGRKLYPAMLTTGLHKYTPKKNNRRKELSVTLGFPHAQVPPTSSGIGKAFPKNEAEETVSHNAKSTSGSPSTRTGRIKKKV